MENKRTPKTQKAYEKYLENIKEKGITPFSENEVISRGSIKEHKLTWRLIKNMFCYDNLGFAPETHLLLIISCKDNKVVNKFIRKVKANVQDYEVFENKKNDRSVHEFRHLHLLDKSVKLK
jgi:hypothetical protein